MRSLMRYLFFILFSVSSFAHEKCEQQPAVMSLAMTQVADAIALEWWSVSPTQYENAVCKTRDVPDWDAYFASRPNDRRRDRKVKGFEFENESNSLIEAFRDIYPGNAPQVSSSCTNVLCAVDEIWGRPLGRKILYIRLRHGYNSSEFTKRNARRLNEIEMNEILITLGDLPPEMENLGRNGNQQMVLAAADEVSNVNAEASADAAITFYNKWRTTSTSFSRQYGLFHEFAHNMARRGSRNLATTSEWRGMAAACPVSTYGRTNPVEDFAETALMYRFNGPGLKEKCPSKYEYLRTNVFSEREYLNETDCRRPLN